jgi:hypothetical protein
LAGAAVPVVVPCWPAAAAVPVVGVPAALGPAAPVPAAVPVPEADEEEPELVLPLPAAVEEIPTPVLLVMPTLLLVVSAVDFPVAASVAPSLMTMPAGGARAET